MDKLRWYDYAAVFMMSDISSAITMAILLGNPTMMGLLPIPIALWLMYENYRKMTNDKEPD
jgi:hypothetical protein